MWAEDIKVDRAYIKAYYLVIYMHRLIYTSHKSFKRNIILSSQIKNQEIK